MNEDLKDKIDALEKENRYLKKLLRENNIDFEYPREVETCKLNSSEKIELFCHILMEEKIFLLINTSMAKAENHATQYVSIKRILIHIVKRTKNVHRVR